MSADFGGLHAVQQRRSPSVRLMEQIAAPENLLAAWRAVRGNIPRYRRSRTVGADGISLDDFERDLAAQLDALRHMLIKGRYQPQPPAFFQVQKQSGGTRQIAVLSITDRVAQRAAQQVLEPIWEPTFLPCSYGFRHGLSTRHAVDRVQSLRERGCVWVVDGDIAHCFDSLDHQLLLKRVGTQVRDPRVIDLLKMWIDQGIMEHGIQAKPVSGLAEHWEKASDGIRQGIDWLISNLAPADDDYPPREVVDDEDDLYSGGLENPYLPTITQTDFRRRAAQQIVTGGVMLGAGWIKPVLGKLGSAVARGLKTTAGRELLRKGALAGGGMVGAAIGVGAAAWMLYRSVAPAMTGILQGSPLSPLLANIYLHSFDVHMIRSGYHLVRFADDWVVCCPSEQVAEQAYNQAIIALDRIRLKINPEKTHILPPEEPVRWLGEQIPAANVRASQKGRLR